MITRRYLALIVFLITLIASTNAQFRYSYLRVGVSGGSTNYLGDLDNDFTFQYSKPAVGIDASFKFNPLMSARVSFMRGWAGAADSTSNDLARNRRNLHFRTPITEISGQLVIDFIAHERGFRRRPAYVPYVTGGIAVFSFNPQAEINGQLVELQPIGTEGQFITNGSRTYPEPYALRQISFPMGAGVRIALAEQWDLELETGFRKTFTDYLDDVSGEYPIASELFEAAGGGSAGARAVALSDPDGVAALNGIRGDRTQADWYVFTVVRLNYIFDWRRCPKF
ncbi:MAG: DUF6089 family protein [Bacteroidota bacterium]